MYGNVARRRRSALSAAVALCAAVLFALAGIPSVAFAASQALPVSPAQSSLGVALGSQADTVDSGTFASDPDASWTLTQDGNLLIAGTGTINESYDGTGVCPWKAYDDSAILSVSVQGSVQATRIDGWFAGCTKLASVAFTSAFGTATCEMAHAFSRCASLKAITLPKGFASTGPGYIDASNMFDGCSSLTTIYMNETLHANRTTASQMFNGCSSLDSIDIPDGFAQSEDSIAGMFQGCSSLKAVYLPTGFGCRSQDITKLFAGCTSLVSLALPEGFPDDFGENATEASGVFMGCTSLTSLALPAGFGAAATTCTQMFSGCSSLASFVFPSRLGTVATDLRAMFGGCTALSSLDLPQGFGQHAQDIRALLAGCSSLAAVDLSSIDMRTVETMGGVFTGCTALGQVKLGPFWSFLDSTSTVALSLPDPVAPYRSWRAVGDGSTAAPTGDAWAPDTLAQQYNQAMADTYVLSAAAPAMPLEGTVGLSGDSYVRGVMSASVSGAQFASDPLCRWYSAPDAASPGVQVGEGPTYTLQANDEGRYLYAVAYDDTHRYAGRLISARSLVREGLPGTVSLPSATSVGSKVTPEITGFPVDATPSCTWFIGTDATSAGTQVGTATFYTPKSDDFGLYLHVVVTDASGRHEGSIASIPVMVTISGTFPSDAAASWTITPDGSLMFTGSGTVKEEYSAQSPAPWQAYASLIKFAAFSGTASYANLGSWFRGCTNLTSIAFPAGFGSGSVDMDNMFEGCSSLARLDLPDGFGSQSPNMTSLCANCTSLEEFSAPQGFGGGALWMTYMFAGCSSLESLDLSNANTSKANVMIGMFDGCTSLRRADLGAQWSFKGSGTTVQCQLPAPWLPFRSWQAVGSGSILKPQGKTWTSAALASSYDASLADTYVLSVLPPLGQADIPGGNGSGDAGGNAAVSDGSSAGGAGSAYVSGSTLPAGRSLSLVATGDAIGRACTVAAGLCLLLAVLVLLSVRRFSAKNIGQGQHRTDSSKKSCTK
jgi:surface protein